GDGLRRAFHQPLPDGGDAPADLRLAFVMHDGSRAVALQAHVALAAHDACRAAPVDEHVVALRRLKLAELDAALKGALDRPNADLHDAFVFVFAGTLQSLAARHNTRQHLRVEEHLPDQLPWSVKVVTAVKLYQAASLFPMRSAASRTASTMCW